MKADGRRTTDGVHAPYGELVRDEESDMVLCHLCGQWFRALGSHVRAHERTADDYRAEFGLYRARPLTSREISKARTQAQQARYRRSPRTRDDMATGRAMAATGRLTALAAEARRARTPSTQHFTGRRDQLAAGRRTMAAVREHRLEVTLARLGFADAETCQRTLYQSRRLDFDTVRAELGIGREQLRTLFKTFGIEPRPPGVNTDAGRASRTRLNDERAAAQIGRAHV